MAERDPEPILRRLGFPPSVVVTSRRAVADLYRLGERCGVYLLLFETGELYCGQALDVTRRFAQHAKNHLDVRAMTFKRVAKERLNEEEQTCIEALEEGGWPLRNVVFTSIPKGESDFDLLMPLVDQERWLNDAGYRPQGTARPDDPDIRRKKAAQFRRFLESPVAEDAVRVLSAYLDVALPLPQSTELIFWSLSCVLERRGNNRILSRVNLNMQEVMTLVEDDGQLWVTWHVAKSPLAPRHDREYRDLRRLWRRLRGCSEDHRYRPGGPDQVSLTVRGATAALAILEDPTMIRAMRLMNLRLMKKGPSYYSRHHCFALVDAAYRGEIPSSVQL